jgi:hypothetical protein
MAKQNTSLAKYDAELAALAEKAAAQEAGVGGGQFFSTKGGTLSFGGAPLPNDEMAVVIIDSVIENAYYIENFDADSPASPVCYAFGRDPETMAPHEESEDKQADACAGCPQNEFGSADRGRGKACGNRRRIAMIQAGTLAKDGSFEPFEDPDAFEKAQTGYFRLSPTSLKSYAQYVKQIAGAFKKPPFAVFTKVSLVEDEKTMFKTCFELLGPVPAELVPVLMERNKAEAELIEFPYAKFEAAPKPKGNARRPLKKNRKF